MIVIFYFIRYFLYSFEFSIISDFFRLNICDLLIQSIFLFQSFNFT